MVHRYNNKQLFLKKLIYRSKYTGIKETDLLLGKFADKYLQDFSYTDLVSYEKLLESGDPRIWRLAVDQELPFNEKEKFLINLIKSFELND